MRISVRPERKAGHRVTIYVPPELLQEIDNYAALRGISVSAVLQQSWRVAKKELMKVRPLVSKLPKEMK